jgi:hypothetical protein
MEIDERILEAVEETSVIRPPKRHLSTFGATNIYYYLLTEPAYAEFDSTNGETVIREGRVIAERPRVVTPFYLTRLDGFGSDARKYFQMLLETHGPDAPGIYYAYKNEPKEMNIVSDSLTAVVEKLNVQIDSRGDPMTSIIKGKDELWDVSLMKFIYEITKHSVQDNINQFGSRGLLNLDKRGVPAEARMRIELLFGKVENGEVEPGRLKEELDRWQLFDEYQDRFFRIFSKKR